MEIENFLDVYIILWNETSVEGFVNIFQKHAAIFEIFKSHEASSKLNPCGKSQHRWKGLGPVDGRSGEEYDWKNCDIVTKH